MVALLSVAVVLFVCSIGHILAQECPDGITTKLVTADISLDLPLTVPACIRCGYIVGFNLVYLTDVTWTKKSSDSIIPLTNRTRGVLIDPNTTTLILNNPGDVISVGDELRCYSAQAQADGHSTGEHIIKILAFNFLNPLISPNDSTVSVVEGSNLILSCDNPGNTGSTSYQWFSVNGSELSNRETTPPALLTFNNIQRTSSGVYICRSSKTNIDMIRESTVTINVQYPPITSVTTSYDGSVFIINCTFDGNPPPSVTWLHNGAPLNINQLTINTQSTYSELIMNTNYSGTYVCTANNTIGHDTSNPITISDSTSQYINNPTNNINNGGINVNLDLDFSMAIVTIIIVVMLLLALVILIIIAVYYYYTKYKKTDRSYRGGVTITFIDDIEKPGTTETSDIVKKLVNTPEMKSDKIIYAELTNFSSVKNAQIKSKPTDSETVIYSELSVAQRQQALQGQPSYEKALYADIGHFTPKDKKNKEPKPSNVDKVVYSELDSIRKPQYVL